MLSYREILHKAGWSSVSSVIFLLIQTAVFFYVTYIIEPHQLGIYSLSIASVLFGIGIIENGFTSSLIHSNSENPEDYNAVLTINNGIAILCSLLLILTCFICYIFQQPILYIKGVIFLLPCLFLAAFNKTQITGLQNKLNFKAIAKLEFWSSLTYLITLLILTYFKMGVWILLCAFLSKFLFTFIFIKASGLQISDQSFDTTNKQIKRHWEYGKYISGEKLISAFITYADTFVVSMTLGLSTLGIYEIFKRIVIRPITILYNGIEQLFFPLLSKSNTDSSGFRKVYRNLTFFSKYLFINIVCFLYVQSDFILSFLPISYQDYGETVRAICVFGATVIIVNPIDILLYSRGQSKLFFNWILAYSIPLLLVIYISSSFGLNTMIYSTSVFYILLYVISYYLLIRKNTPLSYTEYYTVMVYSFILFLASYVVLRFYPDNIYVKLIMGLFLIISSIFHVFYKKIKNNPLS